jgi:hypothetical protein
MFDDGLDPQPGYDYDPDEQVQQDKNAFARIHA